MRRDVAGLTIELVTGDITRQDDIDAVVNAANAQLRTGGGVAGAIHSAAGEGLAEECRPLAPIEPGECVLTGAHDLPNEHVIHCLGPVYGRDDPSDEILASCYRRAMAIADERRLTTIAFPAISTGAFGYPREEAAEVALSAVIDTAASMSSLDLVRFVLYAEQDLHLHESTLERLVD